MIELADSRAAEAGLEARVIEQLGELRHRNAASGSVGVGRRSAWVLRGEQVGYLPGVVVSDSSRMQDLAKHVGSDPLPFCLHLFLDLVGRDRFQDFHENTDGVFALEVNE